MFRKICLNDIFLGMFKYYVPNFLLHERKKSVLLQRVPNKFIFGFAGNLLMVWSPFLSASISNMGTSDSPVWGTGVLSHALTKQSSHFTIWHRHIETSASNAKFLSIIVIKRMHDNHERWISIINTWCDPWFWSFIWRKLYHLANNNKISGQRTEYNCCTCFENVESTQHLNNLITQYKI